VDFPTFKVEDRELPIMLCGSSPFVGLGQFGFKAFDYRVRFYNHPDSMADIFVHFIRKGCKGAHIHCYDNILKAVKMAYDIETFPLVASLTAKDAAPQLKKLSRLETALVFVHPSHTDSLDDETLSTITRAIRDAGVVPGLATNVPGTSIPALEAMDIDFSAYLAPIDKIGKFMIPKKDVTLQAVKDTEKVVLSANPLPGKIKLEEGLSFVMGYCDGFCVGFTEKEQIDAAYDVLKQVAT
jgi:hypothetical protein